MKIYLEKAIFINRAPFNNIELDFIENEVAVLTAVNGKGKTTILSYIVDVFYEMAKPHFPFEFEDKPNKFYRVSSPLYNINQNLPSYVYLRFKTEDSPIDYVDIRNNCTLEQYDAAITIDNKIPFDQIKLQLEAANNVKKVSLNFDKKKADQIFSNNLLTFFPSYRFEVPGYLNDPYKTKLDYKKTSEFAGYLTNPIEVVTGLPQLANWLMDIILDLWRSRSSASINNSIDKLISLILISKNLGDVVIDVGDRHLGGVRLQIGKYVMDNGDTRWSQIYPTIFNLSSGETALLCLFGELIRQADNNKSNIELNEITGIVIIDEIDKHLHIKLQKEILPALLELFPNVQFILSSHSPFLSMGLADTMLERSKIIDLDNMGISKDPTTNDLYKEVYEMMIGENERFRELYQKLEQKIRLGTAPLIITEGKTDVQHIKKAKEKLNIKNCEIEFYEIADDWGDSKLKLLLEQLSKVHQTRKLIGIFDRDDPKIVSDIEKGGQLFKYYSNNVYAFCIPIPLGRENYTNISIEFYYTDEIIKKEKDGKRLYFDNEVDYLHNKSINKSEIRILDYPRLEKEFSKKVFDEQKMCEITTLIHSKTSFAILVETDTEFSENIDFSSFQLIFDKIVQIIDHTSE